ncbi:amino acid ABC transporter permease [Conexibacter sp. JD483]|uniref:amino acid ABC transporter permease n=1 Tax=unclassified Conexibacter TaxID=2627773 RepID=UPI002720E5BD|nr:MULTISPECIES: amino acid ABC transporter permease [unclassified Conexibacter]MDO8185268.1 amino acid ABC transporter permease [Conexibacter sp. CPCC 205706]MDO8198314.1 amino acid ABC transporter permease [Conexibacter sp. CPCC 205762]MDR9367725.1 amino acid ABC transporter permease [Conexibacter sp. JD483]
MIAVLPFAFDYSVVSEHSGELLRGLLLTVEVAACGFALAAVLGLPLALAGRSRTPLLRIPATMWIALARGVPLLIVIFWLYYAAAQEGLFSLTAFIAGMLSLGLTGSGYMAEIYRSALSAVPTGQFESAAAIGLSRAQAFRVVILPQALRTAIPPAMNTFVMLLKGATLLSVIGLADMFYAAKLVAVNEFKPFELYTAAAVLVIAVTLVAAIGSGLVERRLSKGVRR